MQKADPQVGREIGQMLGVRLEPLVRIDAERAGIRQPESAFGGKPLVQKVVDQPLAQDDLRALIEPHLRDVEDEEDSRDHPEDPELRHEAGHVLVGQRIVERAVPGI